MAIFGRNSYDAAYYANDELRLTSKPGLSSNKISYLREEWNQSKMFPGALSHFFVCQMSLTVMAPGYHFKWTVANDIEIFIDLYSDLYVNTGDLKNHLWEQLVR